MPAKKSEPVPSGKSVDRSAGWDRADFAARFRDAYRTLWLIAGGVLGSRSGIEDVLQEAAAVALSKPDQFQAGTSFRAWMGQIVRFVALNHGRRVQREGANVAELDQLPQRSASPGPGMPSGRERRWTASDADRLGFDDELLTHLRDLSETARACLLLRTIEGLEYSEISKALDIPEGTAMSHVHRSRRQLRERLSHRAPE
ncbi:MAG: ECF RNA polymerase sigma factor SigH [Phycisphaerae bacterium]|nr:ECF RNA polymerase sigma factor SigH [Phycisphaerae bacterium]